MEVGAITFVQRFGGALNLNPHLHVLVADGAFVCPEDGRAPRFVATSAPTRAEMAEVLRGVATRVARITTVRADDGLDALRAAAMARGTVARLTFEGQGCTISQAAASILTEIVAGRTLDEVEAMDFNDMIDLLGREVVSTRPRCATLALGTLKAAVARYRRQGAAGGAS